MDKPRPFESKVLVSFLLEFVSIPQIIPTFVPEQNRKQKEKKHY